MKILVIGFGSIGKRHFSNLVGLGHEVSVVSSKKVPDASFTPSGVYERIDAAFALGSFDAAFICSPTAFHVRALLQLLQLRVPRIYVEKPVSDKWDDTNSVLALAAQYEPKICVGYDLHFEPGFVRVRSLLNENAIGRLVSVQAFAGQWLPQWRPYEDHRHGMSAKIESGGGVLLDLIHEMDYLYSLAGNIRSVYCQTLNSGLLGIETEESADVLIGFEDGCTATLHLDYLQPELKRYAVFTGTAGSITWDLAGCSVVYKSISKDPDVFSYKDSVRNDRFIAIAKAFLENEPDDRLVSLEAGLKSLQAVVAAKRSVAENRVVAIDEIIY